MIPPYSQHKLEPYLLGTLVAPNCICCPCLTFQLAFKNQLDPLLTFIYQPFSVLSTHLALMLWSLVSSTREVMSPIHYHFNCVSKRIK